MIVDLLFYLGLSLLLVHELDAIRCHEWRIFPFIKKMEDRAGYRTFLLLHVPILVIIFWFVGHPNEITRVGFQIVMDIFFIFHGIIHFLMRKKDGYEFNSLFSKSVIATIAVTGMVHLVMLINH